MRIAVRLSFFTRSVALAIFGLAACDSQGTADPGICGNGVVEWDEGCDAGDVGDAHCIECRPVFGWVCEGAPSTCQQTGLAPDSLLDDLSDAEITTYCEWSLGILGGPGSGVYCEHGEYAVLLQDQCEGYHSTADHRSCTVGDFETWAASHADACVFLAAPAPSCLAGG